MGIPIVVYPLFIGSSELPEEMHDRCNHFRCKQNDRVFHELRIRKGACGRFRCDLDCILIDVLIKDIVDMSDEHFCADNRYDEHQHTDSCKDGNENLCDDRQNFQSGFHDYVPPSNNLFEVSGSVSSFLLH